MNRECRPGIIQTTHIHPLITIHSSMRDLIHSVGGWGPGRGGGGEAYCNCCCCCYCLFVCFAIPRSQLLRRNCCGIAAMASTAILAPASAASVVALPSAIASSASSSRATIFKVSPSAVRLHLIFRIMGHVVVTLAREF